jgi:hypothetical protein
MHVSSVRRSGRPIARPKLPLLRVYQSMLLWADAPPGSWTEAGQVDGNALPAEVQPQGHPKSRFEELWALVEARVRCTRPKSAVQCLILSRMPRTAIGVTTAHCFDDPADAIRSRPFSALQLPHPRSGRLSPRPEYGWPSVQVRVGDYAAK